MVEVERITIEDVRRAGHCVTGARVWFKMRGFNWRDFVANGIEAEALLATGDGLAERVVAHARMNRHG